jgi:DNA-directed RNA polymerase specialized sigma24 family protein
MDSEGSVTHWIDQLRGGDREAVGPLWQRYFARLVAVARERLRGARRAAADEEDVALSAFDSFCRAAEAGRFPRLEDRDDLWRLLAVIAERKAVDLARAQSRKRRGGDRVRDEVAGLGWLPSGEPTPEFAAVVAEECRRLLDRLDDDGLRRMALMKMEGYGNEEIAGQLGCALRTVERKLGVIRGLWSRELAG